ncbi:MAG: malonyl-ACP O-methyltransferase BioC [Candidatus Berkiellales bacterium]
MTPSRLPVVKKADIARSFSEATKTYDQHAFVQKEIGQRLLERLRLIKIPPNIILDVGAGTGFLTRQLQQQFPKSHIIGVDLAQGMTHYAKQQQPWHLWKNKPYYVCGDTEMLPLKNNSVDLIFSNFTLQWCFNLKAAFAEFKRVLKPNGMLFFTTLGPQTLFELRQSFATVDHFTHVNEFIDMHDIGDALLRTQFTDPIMDMEMITVTYANVNTLLHDLKATGAHNIHFDRPMGLTSKNGLKRMLKAYDAFQLPNGLYPATFEIIYGHAFQAIKRVYQQDEDGIIRIPADRVPLLA